MMRLHPDRFTDTPIDQVRAALGNAMEKAIIREVSRREPERYVIPGELEYEGLLGTPDLWDLKPKSRCRRCGKRCPFTVEIKLTWASSRRASDIEDEWFWRYWVQMKSYSKMAEFHRGLLIIIFVVGDWKDGPPVGFMWEDDWDDDELSEVWEMVNLYATKE